MGAGDFTKVLTNWRTGSLGYWSTGILLCLILLGFSDTSYCLNVSPGRIEISVAPAKGYEDVLLVRNTEKNNLEVKLRIEDWFKAPEGAGKEKSSGFDWLEIKPLEFELKEGEIKQVNFKVTIPKNARGELNGMLFVEGRPKETAEGAIGINTSIGIPIYVMIKGTEQFKAEVEGLEVVNRSPLELTVKIKNRGNVHIRPTGAIEIKNKNGILITIPLNEYNYPVLPLSSRTLEIRSDKKLEQGEYVADIKMGYGDKKCKKKIILNSR